MEAESFCNPALIRETEFARFPVFDCRDKGLNARDLQAGQIFLKLLVAARTHDDGEAGVFDPVNVFHSNPEELVEALAHAGDTEVQGGSILNERNKLVEVRSRVRSGQRDAHWL